MGFKLAPGDKPLSGYIIRRGVGVGGFGEVYFAVSESGKEVALKRIHRNLDVELRGASQCLNLRHPNLVGLYDIRQEDAEQAWIVMEYIVGESLKDRLDARPKGLEKSEVLYLFGQLAAGVHYLHEQGIVHRDLKPANIFIENNLVKIGDYGLSKFISASRRGGHTESVGTFHYMAPEIGKGEYGKEIDIYSLGIILYEMLTGQVPFDGETSQEIILKHLTADPDVQSIEPPFRQVILQALAKDPKLRPSNVIEMLQPLGIQIDPNGMAQIAPSRSALHGEDLPVVNGHSVSAATVPKAAPVGEPSRRSIRYYREPVANEVASVLAELHHQMNRVRYDSPWFAVVFVAALFVLVFFGPAFVPFLVFAFAVYLPYYVVWYLIYGVNLPPIGTEPLRNLQSPALVKAPPAATPPPGPIFRPLSFHEWQSQQRSGLAKKPFAKRWSEWTGSAILASMMLGFLTTGGYIALLALRPDATESTRFIAVGVWTIAMTLATTWSALFFAKRWEACREDTLVYRIVLFGNGLALGVLAWFLSEFMMVPWPEFVSAPVQLRFFPRTPFALSGDLSWPAFLGSFGLLMGSIRWWRQGDVLRRNRLSLFSFLWTIFVAALIGGLIGFPIPCLLIIAGGTSLLTQLSTQNVDARHRPRFVQVHSSGEIRT